MAVPGAVTRRKEQEEQNLREQGFDPNGAPLDLQGEPTLSVVPTSPAAPVVDEATALKTRIAELEAAQSTSNGRTSAAATEAEELKKQLEIVNGNRSFLESKLTELTDQVNTLQSQNDALAQKRSEDGVATAVAALDGTGPTPEQIEKFDSETVDFVQRITKQQLAAVVKPLLERLASMEKVLARVKEIDTKMPQLESAAAETHTQTARNKELEFLQKEVLPHYPDFEKMRVTPEWKTYLQQEVPGRGYKVGHLLQTHRQTANAIGIRTILAGFYDTVVKKPSLDALTVPAKTGADVPNKPAAPKMKASEYKQNLKDFTSKRLSKADWEAYRTHWDQAISSGNVEMDVEIR